MRFNYVIISITSRLKRRVHRKKKLAVKSRAKHVPLVR